MKDSLGVIGLLAAGALTSDYLINGDKSIVGKFLREAFGLGKGVGPAGDPNFGRPLFGEPSTSDWELPVKTLRHPFPLGEPDSAGRIMVPFHEPSKAHSDKHVKHGCSKNDFDRAAWAIASTVYSDMSVYGPTTKFMMGDSQTIHDRVIAIYDGPDTPEIFVKLAQFHAKHGGAVYGNRSLQDQHSKLVGSAADLYESAFGAERMFSREGFAYVGEYDNQNDRLAAQGAESPIHFGVGGAYALEFP